MIHIYSSMFLGHSISPPFQDSSLLLNIHDLSPSHMPISPVHHQRSSSSQYSLGLLVLPMFVCSMTLLLNVLDNEFIQYVHDANFPIIFVNVRLYFLSFFYSFVYCNRCFCFMHLFLLLSGLVFTSI